MSWILPKNWDDGPWMLSWGSDPRALAVVDGIGFEGGPHYSRRTPGSKTFVGVGQDLVLVTRDVTAVWAVVRQRTPSARGTGRSRGRDGAADTKPRYVWRNNMFCNRGQHRSSDLIRAATIMTYCYWSMRYGRIPSEPLRTEVKPSAIRSTNPGFCYQCAGWRKGESRRGLVLLYAPLDSWFADMERSARERAA